MTQKTALCCLSVLALCVLNGRKRDAIKPTEQGSEPWNGIMKNAPEGYVFERTITDDTCQEKQ